MAPTTHSQTHEKIFEAQFEGSGNINATSGTQIIMEAFMQALAIFGQSNTPRRNDRTQEQGKISEFKKLSPTSFAGTTDPLEAKKWLSWNSEGLLDYELHRTRKGYLCCLHALRRCL